MQQPPETPPPPLDIMRKSVGAKQQREIRARMPSNEDAERVVLGAILLDGKQTESVAETVQPEDFNSPQNRMIYAAMKGLSDTKALIDRVTVADELMRRGQFEAAGGLTYLVTLDDNLPDQYNLESYCSILREYGLKRRVCYAAQKVLEQALTDHEKTSSELIETAEREFSEIGKAVGGRAGVTLAQYIDSYEGGINALLDVTKRKTGVPFCMPKFDEMTGGLYDGELMTLAGRPGSGKTALALCLASNIAKYTKRRVIFHSLEMSKDPVFMRLLFRESGVPSSVMREKRQLTKDERDRLQGAVAALYDENLVLDDTPSIDPHYLQRNLAAHRRVGEVAAIFIDYVQLMSAGPSRGMFRGDYERMTAISQGVMSLAKKTKVPIVVLSQLRRTAEKGKIRRPNMEDLRGTGQLEADSWVVGLLHREDGERRSKANKVELIIDKNRLGETGIINMLFDGARSSFSEAEDGED